MGETRFAVVFRSLRRVRVLMLERRTRSGVFFEEAGARKGRKRRRGVRGLCILVVGVVVVIEGKMDCVWGWDRVRGTLSNNSEESGSIKNIHLAA